MSGTVFYEKKIAIPPTATQQNPHKEKITLKRGILTQISVLIPDGQQATGLLTIWDGERQIVPENSDGRIRGDGETLPIPFFYRIDSDFYDLEARGWVEGTSQERKLYLRLSVLPEAYVLPQLALGRVLDRILSLWSRITGVRG